MASQSPKRCRSPCDALGQILDDVARLQQATDECVRSLASGERLDEDHGGHDWRGGVIAFSKAHAREVAAKGVTVNVVCPGPTDTALLDQVAAASQKLYDGLAKAVPMRRIGQPADIAPAVVFLASDGAGYITGQTLSVSGGLTMA